MTPRQFGMLLERDEERRRTEDRRAGEIVATLTNIHVDRKKYPKGIDWMDVFPEWKAPEVQSEDQMYQAMLMWTEATKPRERAATE